MAKDKDMVVDIEGKHLKLSNLDKVLYPEAGFTKGQVIDYFVRIAPVLLPHLHGRPLTMKRYPNGVSGMFFYEKNCPEHRPEWVQTARGVERGQQSLDELLHGRGPAHAGVGGEPRRSRTAYQPVAGQRHSAAHVSRLRPRSRARPPTSCSAARSACGCATSSTASV